MDENSFTVRKSTVGIWVGSACSMVFSVIYALVLVYQNGIAGLWSSPITEFGVVILFSVVFAVYCTFCKLEVTGSELRYSLPLMRVRAFTFGEIDKVKLKRPNTPGEKITLYLHAKKLLSVDVDCKGYGLLLARLKRESVPFE